MTSYDVISFGTIYLDVDFLHFPFEDGLYAHRETVGDVYSLEAGGSAFNFAKMCGNLEQKVLFIGQLGQDQVGRVIEMVTTHAPVTTHFIKYESFQSNIAVHYVKDNGDSIMTSAGSANQNLSVSELEKTLTEYLDKTTYLYLGGGLKLEKVLPAYPRIIGLAKQKGVKVVLDHCRVTNLVSDEQKQIIKSIISDIDIYLPSKDEFLDLWGFSSLDEGLQQMQQKFSGTVVVKDSINGCHSIEGGTIVAVAPVDVKPVNTIGAGDSFNAGFIKASLLGFDDLPKKMQFASATAGVRISQNKMPTVSEVEQLITENY